MKLVDNLSRHKISHVFKSKFDHGGLLTLEIPALVASDLLGMFDSGERSLPFGRLVDFLLLIAQKTVSKLILHHMGKMFIIYLLR